LNALFCLITIFPILAQSFLRPQGFLMNYDLFPFLARSFFRIQGLGRIQNGAVLLYCEYLNLGRKRSSRKKNPLKKTKPFQSQTKPFFQRPNFNLSPKTTIFDKFRKTFLCKTKPFFSKIQIENKGLTVIFTKKTLKKRTQS